MHLYLGGGGKGIRLVEKEEDFENKDDYKQALNALWVYVDEAFREVFGTKHID